jgi:hypothetical protein
VADLVKAEAPGALGFVKFDNIAEAIKFASYIAASELVPKAYRDKPADIVIAMQMGMELGFSAMQALQSIAVINGKPNIYGDAIPALIVGQADCDDFIEEKPQGEDPDKWVARCTIKRRGRTPVVYEFSWADAKRAKLVGKQGPWQEYPKRQMQMRARGFAARDAYPDRLKGIITAEEAQDYPADPLFAEPKRIGQSSTLETPAPPAETPAVDGAATEAPVADVAAPPPPKVGATLQTMRGLAVLDSAVTKDDRGLVYRVQTSEGEFLTRDQAHYDVLAPLEGTDHTVAVTYKEVGSKTLRVRALQTVAVEATEEPAS